jgi:hypothetical protein
MDQRSSSYAAPGVRQITTMPDPERLTPEVLEARYETPAPTAAPAPEPAKLLAVRLPRICPTCGREFWVDGVGVSPGPARYQFCDTCRPKAPAPRAAPDLTRPQRTEEE